MCMCVCVQSTSSLERLTLSAAKEKRLPGYFHPPLRTTHSPIQTCLKPQSQQVAKEGYELRSNC